MPVLLVVACGLLIYFFFHFKSKSFPSAALALPRSAVFIYQGSSPEKSFASIRNTDIYRFFHSNGSITKFEEDFEYFDSLISKKEKLKNLFSKNPLLMSLYITGTASSDFLFLNQTEEVYNKEEIFNLFRELNPQIEFSERNFEGKPVYDAKDKNKNDVFSFALLDGILALSRNSSLVEDAVNTYKGGSKTKLTEALANPAKKEQFVINYSNIPVLFSSYLKPEYLEQIQGIREYIGFGIYSINCSNDNLTLEGTIGAEDGTFLPKAFGDSPAPPLDIQNVIPSNAAIMMAWQVSDFGKYIREEMKFRGKEVQDQWEKYQAAHNFKEDDFFKLFKGEWAYVLSETSDENDTAIPVLVCKIDTNQKGILEKINKGDAAASLEFSNSRSDGSYRKEIFTTYSTDFKNLTEILFGKMFSGLYNPTYIRLGEYLYFFHGGIREAQSLVGINNPANIAAWKSNLGDKKLNNNFTFYINPSRASKIPLRMFKPEYLKDYKNNLPLINGLDGVVFGIGKNSSSIVIKHLPSNNKKIEGLWQYTLDAEAASAPQALKANDGSENIFISDADNNAYLFNSIGKLLWKKQMDGLLSGTACVIDLYDNDNTQYLFASKNSLYLVDKDGKDAGNYPLHLGSKSTSGVAMFDFSNNKNYKYFVGTQNNRIYGYNGNGKPIPGWNPQMIDAPLVMPMQSFTTKDETYLYGVSNRGTMYIWKTSGDRALKPIEMKTRFMNPFKVIPGDKFSGYNLVSVDTSGTLYGVDMQREIKRRDFKVSSGKVFFEYADLDANEKNEYIISNGKSIAAYEKEKKPWKVKAESKITFAPQIFIVDGNPWIGYVSEDRNKIYLVSKSGKLYKDFPLTGNRPFVVQDFNSDGSYELVTAADGRKLIMYKLK